MDTLLIVIVILTIIAFLISVVISFLKRKSGYGVLFYINIFLSVFAVIGLLDAFLLLFIKDEDDSSTNNKFASVALLFTSGVFLTIYTIIRFTAGYKQVINSSWKKYSEMAVYIIAIILSFLSGGLLLASDNVEDVKLPVMIITGIACIMSMITFWGIKKWCGKKVPLEKQKAQRSLIPASTTPTPTTPAPTPGSGFGRRKGKRKSLRRKNTSKRRR